MAMLMKTAQCLFWESKNTKDYILIFSINDLVSNSIIQNSAFRPGTGKLQLEGSMDHNKLFNPVKTKEKMVNN